MANQLFDRLLRFALAGRELTAQVISQVGQGYVVDFLGYDAKAFLSERYVSGMHGQALGEGTILKVSIVAISSVNDRLRIEVTTGLSLEQQQVLLYWVRREEQEDFRFLEHAKLMEGVWLTFHPHDETKIDRAVRDSQLPPLLKEKRRFWNKMTEIQTQKENLHGRILQSEQRGEGRRVGYIVALSNPKVAAFMPESEAYIPGERIELSDGAPVEVRVSEIDPFKKGIVVSQRMVLEERRAARLRQLKPYLRSGVLFRGRVKKVEARRAVIDIGGMQGYLPISEMSAQWVDDPSKVVKEGEIKDLAIKEYSETQGRSRLIFSLKLVSSQQLVSGEWSPFGYEEYQIRLFDTEQEDDLVSSIAILDTEDEMAEIEEDDWENWDVEILE